jgi:hypothetical protein
MLMPVLRMLRNGGIAVIEHGEPDRMLDPADPLSLLTHIRSMPEFEEGLTAHEMMRCLKPWSAILSRTGWLDFDRWDRAMAKPPSKFPDDSVDRSAEDNDPPLSSVAIIPVLNARLRKKERPNLNLTWQTVGLYLWPRVDPDMKHEDLHCSLSFSPPQSWAHLPIILERRAWISEIDYAREGRRILADGIGSTATAPSELEVTPTLLSAVIVGFLDDISYHGDPDEAKKTGEMIGEMVEAIRNGEAIGTECTPGFMGIDDEDDQTRH